MQFASRCSAYLRRVQDKMDTDDYPDPRIAMYDRAIHVFCDVRMVVSNALSAAEQGPELKVRIRKISVLCVATLC